MGYLALGVFVLVVVGAIVLRAQRLRDFRRQGEGARGGPTLPARLQAARIRARLKLLERRRLRSLDPCGAPATGNRRPATYGGGTGGSPG